MTPSGLEPPLRTALQEIVHVGRTLLGQGEFRAVVACSMVMGLAVSFVLPFFSLFGTSEVGMSLAGFGAFMTTTAVLNIVISTVLSHRSDTRYSRRTLLLTGSLCGALGYLGYAFVREVWVLLVIGGLVLGVASITFSQLFAYARELIDEREIPASDAALYTSAIRMCFALSWTIGPAVAAVTLGLFGFRGLFLVSALLYALFFGLVWRFVPASERRVSHALTPALSLRTYLMKPDVLAWFVAFALVFSAHTMSMSNMSLFVLKELGGTETHVGIIFGLAPVFELPLMLYFGLLATRMPPARLIRVAVTLAVMYYALLSLVRAPWHIYPLQLLSAAIVAVTGGVAITFFQNKLPGQSGAATNLYMNAGRIGSTSGYLLFGAVASRFGHRGAYVACATLAVAALMLTLMLDRTRQRPLRSAGVETAKA